MGRQGPAWKLEEINLGDGEKNSRRKGWHDLRLVSSLVF